MTKSPSESSAASCICADGRKEYWGEQKHRKPVGPALPMQDRRGWETLRRLAASLLVNATARRAFCRIVTRLATTRKRRHHPSYPTESLFSLDSFFTVFFVGVVRPEKPAVGKPGTVQARWGRSKWGLHEEQSPQPATSAALTTRLRSAAAAVGATGGAVCVRTRSSDLARSPPAAAQCAAEHGVRGALKACLTTQ